MSTGTPLADLIRPTRLEDVVPELAAEAHAARTRITVPLFVQIPAALGLVLASLFLCGGFTMLLQDGIIVGLLGVGLAATSIAASWLSLPWFGRPLVLSGAVLARLLIGWSVGGDLLGVVMPLVELGMLALHRDGLNRAFAAATLPAWVLKDLEHLTPIVTTLALFAGGALVVLRRVWLPWPAPAREVAAACANGWLGLALVLPCVEGPPWSLVFSGGMALVTAGLAAVLAARAGTGNAAVAAAVAVPLALAAFTAPVPGVLVAMIVAMVGFVGRSPRLWVAAVAAMTAYGVYFYYDLDWTLVVKGGAMIGAGGVLTLGGLFAGTFRDRSAPVHEARPVAAPSPRTDRALIGAGAVVAVAAVFAAVVVQEVQLARSEVVYLRLVPVDPRSLVQGDYMRLGYAVEADLRAHGAGIAVLALTPDGVASFARLDDGTPLAANERRIRFFDTQNGKAVTSRAYLFQEGTAELYEPAVYGMVAVTPEGRGALVGLADDELKRLGPPPRRW